MSDLELDAFMYEIQKLFVDNRPHFDWCIAQLGSLFPVKFISSVLRMPEMFTPPMISQTVALIEHLSKTRTKEQNLNSLLKNFVGEAFKSESERGKLSPMNCIPNLLQLSFHSEIYAQVMIDVFLEEIESNNDQSITQLKNYFEANSMSLDKNPERLQKMISELITKTKTNGTKLLLILAEKVRKVYIIHTNKLLKYEKNLNNLFQISQGEDNKWFMELLEIIMNCIQHFVYKRMSCSLLEELKKDSTWNLLWKACKSENFTVQSTAVRLILFTTYENNSLFLEKTIEKLICTNSREGFSALVKILESMAMNAETIDISKVFSQILLTLSIDIHSPSNRNCCYFMLKNILTLLEYEDESQSFKNARIKIALQNNASLLIKIWKSLQGILQSALEDYKVESTDSSKYLKRIKLEDKDDDIEIADFEEEKEYTSWDHNILVTEIIDKISPIQSLNMSDLIRCVKLTVKNFFLCLTEKNVERKIINLNRCYSLLNKQCSNRRTIRSVALRDLLEGSLFLYPNLFGAPTKDRVESSHKQRCESLLKYNQLQGISLNISKSSILHSGVIGSGVQKITQQWSPLGLDVDIKNIFLKAIIFCCAPLEDLPVVSPIANKIVMDGLCQLSHLLVELVSNDVLYNGMSWPEEDLKTTMERDLHIRRTFRNSHILWPLMGLLATYKQPLWNCSVFLRAICASVIHNWQAKSTENVSGNNTELYFFTVKLLEILSMGQMIPPPLTYLHIVIQYLEPNEIAYVLKECVWNYMVFNGISMPNGDGFETNLKMREQPLADQFVDPLRYTMQKKLNILGNLYHQMFLSSTSKTDQ